MVEKNPILSTSSAGDVDDPLEILHLSEEELARIPDALLSKIAVSCAMIKRNSIVDLLRGSVEASIPDYDIDEGQYGRDLFLRARELRAKIGASDMNVRRHILNSTVSVAMNLYDSRRAALTERNIEKLLDLYMEGEERSNVDNAIELDNARLRAEYLKTEQTLTSLQIHRQAPNRPKNRSEPASRWKREGRVFAVRHAGIDYYPKFQFADGEPKPELREVLSKLPNDMSPWQIAFWFASENSWLDDRRPQDSLKSKLLNSAIEALHQDVIG